MAYIPLNKVITNLYTSGGEFQFSDGRVHIGPYWKNYKGQFFSGVSPNDKPIVQIFQIEDATQNESLPQPFIQNAALYNNETREAYRGPYVISDDLTEYNRINKIDISKVKASPVQSYPRPSVDQYLLGQFTRCFCYKINEPIFIELDPQTYNAIKNKDPKWDFKTYIPFTIPWSITGISKTIERVNKNQVLIAEKTTKRKNLGLFLNFNYTKFALDLNIYKQMQKDNPKKNSAVIADMAIKAFQTTPKNKPVSIVSKSIVNKSKVKKSREY